MKIFCIGLTKTGTTSFNQLVSALGYRTHGYSKPLLLEYLDHGGIGPAIGRAINNHDAFDDWPWPYLYRELLEQLGDEAFFVLTRRKSPEVWLSSIKRYSLNSRTQAIRRLTYGTDFPHGFEQHYLHRYRSHLDDVRNHFQSVGRTHQLLDIEAGDPLLLPAICKAFGIEPPNELQMPHSNPTRQRPKIARENLVMINRSLLGVGKRPLTMEEAQSA